jgi:hypothetical protein
MSNPRSTGLLLLLTGVLVLMGNTMDVLPAAAFWAGLATYPIGGYLFFVGSRRASEKAETRTARALDPQLKNRQGEELARLQEQQVVHPDAPRQVDEALADAPNRAAPPQTVATSQPKRDELVLYEIDAEEDED